MSFHVAFYFAASAIILTQTTFESVNGQFTTEGCTHDDLSMNIITEIQQQIVRAFGEQNKQTQNNHDILIASFQQLISQQDTVMRSLQAVDRRLEEHDVYIKQGQSIYELLNESFQEMKSQHETVKLSLQVVDRRLQNCQIDIKNQTQQSSEFVNDVCDPISPVRDCSDIKARGYTVNGVYEVCVGHPPNRVCTNAFCDMNTTNTASLVFQRRKDGSVNFNRTWAEYRNGFGNPDGEFWLGNEMLYLLTSKRNYKLRVDLEDWEGEKRYAEYSMFSINSSVDNYRLTIGGYSGNAGNSLDYSNGRQFSTIDVDNDSHGSLHCAVTHGGAWWHGGCSFATPNGIYYHQRYDTVSSETGIHWSRWKNGMTYSLKATEMKLVPVA